MSPSAPASRPPAPTGRPAGPPAGQTDRRGILLAAGVLIGALVIGVLLVAVFGDPGTPDATGSDAPPAEIVPKPNSGAAPEEPGDRGGWEQLALLGLILATFVGIGFAVARGGGAAAKARRAAWKAAAQSDHDGAVDP